MSDIGQQLRSFDRCPLCSVASPLLEYRSYISYRESVSSPKLCAWLVYQCSSCGGPVCANVSGEEGHFRNVTQFFDKLVSTEKFLPDLEPLSEHLPDRARRYLEQARESINSPDGAAMLANSAVDSMLKAKGLTKGTVFERLKKAVAEGLLTKDMKDWADAVRIESNNPRHADLDDPHVTAERATLMADFAKALGEILFVLPAKAAIGKVTADELDTESQS